MRYLLFVFILFIVSCSKEDDTPKYNPLYSQIKGDWITDPHPNGGTIRKAIFSNPEDSTYIEYVYPFGRPTNENTNYRYYINNVNKIFIREKNSDAWIDRQKIKVINDTLHFFGIKYHR